MANPFEGIDLADVQPEPDHPTDQPPRSEPADFTTPTDRDPADALEWLGLKEGRTTYFDIETGPESEDRLKELFQFDVEKVCASEITLSKSEFDPAGVKTGNLKDQAKIDAKIAAAASAHQAAKIAALEKICGARDSAWASFVERAPLDARTGRVLTICYGQRPDTIMLDDGAGWERVGQDVHERAMLVRFWNLLDNVDARLIGFNCESFDIPFIVRRSWYLGVELPIALHDVSNYAWRINRAVVDDLLMIWRFGKRQSTSPSGLSERLDELARWFGVSRKTGDGANFHRLWFGTEEEHCRAMDYAIQDVRVTMDVAGKMGVV